MWNNEFGGADQIIEKNIVDTPRNLAKAKAGYALLRRLKPTAIKYKAIKYKAVRISAVGFNRRDIKESTGALAKRLEAAMGFTPDFAYPTLKYISFIIRNWTIDVRYFFP
jgi:hypothetical protein